MVMGPNPGTPRGLVKSHAFSFTAPTSGVSCCVTEPARAGPPTSGLSADSVWAAVASVEATSNPVLRPIFCSIFKALRVSQAQLHALVRSHFVEGICEGLHTRHAGERRKNL